MASYEIRPLQLRILEILQTIDSVCKERGLRYYIIAGTLLGAVRHKGFIPWDDDLDIAMPRPDYEALKKNASAWFPKHFEFINGEDDERFPFMFSKIQDDNTTLLERKHVKNLGGVFVDVFPLDGVPEKGWGRTLHFIKFSFYKKLKYFVYRDPFKHGKGINSWIPRLCRKFVSKEYVHLKIKKLMLKYSFNDSKYVVDYDDSKRGIFPKEIFGDPKPILFEGVEVNGISKPHDYLAHKYGDYMVIPDGDHQIQHDFYLMDLNKSYHDQDIEELFR